jgi:hypothetical protein
MSKIGILAYGSLIDFPGEEISPLIVDRLECTTPFKVEYARKSKIRGNGPTLIPTENIGKKVKAVVLIIKDETDLDDAKSILWRRETGNIKSKEEYKHSENPSRNKVQVEITNEIIGVETVLYTSIGNNINGLITAENLSDLAIESILSEAGKNKKDGIRYLLANKQNGIITEMSDQYEKCILAKTGCKTLEESIAKMDSKRENKASR